MQKDHIARMLAEAQARRHDADILGGSLITLSDSQAFLRVLVFEVLLKAAVIASGTSRAQARGHKYNELWNKLPADIQTSIVDFAISRMPGHTDFSDLCKLLDWYRFIFEKARYGFELYEGYTSEEVRQLGEQWMEQGAPIEDAFIQYYPCELECLTEALIQYIESALRSK